MDTNLKPLLEFRWEVTGRDHGAEVTETCDDINQVLDFCGRLLYGNSVFVVTLLQVRHEEAEGEMSGWAAPECDARTYKWVMKPLRQGQARPARFFDHTHDLFGMLIAELRQGSDHIEISRNH